MRDGSNQPARRGDAPVGDDRYQPKLAPLLDAVAVEDIPMGEEVRPERRKASVRRDLNDMVRDPAGKVAESKTFAVAFKAAMVWVFLERAEQILKDWMVLAVFVTAMLMPDLLKKVMTMKLGQPKDQPK